MPASIKPIYQSPIFFDLLWVKEAGYANDDVTTAQNQQGVTTWENIT
jgi:hypothetical protein